MSGKCEGEGGGGGKSPNAWIDPLVIRVILYTDKKENKIFPIYKENQMGCANFSPYMRRPLVIYDFAVDPSDSPYIQGKFSFLFYQCNVPNCVH